MIRNTSLIRSFSFVLAASAAFLVGCGGSNTPSSTAATHKIYVVQQVGTTDTGGDHITGTSVLEFSSASNGTANVPTTLTLPTGFFAYSVATDSAGNIYVGGNNGDVPSAGAGEILVFAAGATGSATPTRTISGAAAGLGYPEGFAFDSSGNLYVSDNFLGTHGGIGVFSATASGNVAPVRLISGLNTKIVTLRGIALDSAGNIYAANVCCGGASQVNVLIFGSTATGNVAPLHAILGTATTLGVAYGVAVDSSGKLYVANDGFTGASSVAVFAAGADGNVAPIQTIAGSNTGFNNPQGIALDSNGNIYVEDVTTTSTDLNNSPTMKVFSAGSNGNVAPMQSFSSTSWTAGSSTIAVF